MGRLKGTRVYLCGPMDRCPDGGEGWRKNTTPFLQNLGVTVLDPTNKPCASFHEDKHVRNQIRILKEDEQYKVVASLVKPIRSIDLRMVDISDFLIAHINLDIFAFGTIEEMVLANYQRKPILTFVYPHKKSTPTWLFGMIPEQHIFSNLLEIGGYLEKIDGGFDDGTERWKFFDYLEK